MMLEKYARLLVDYCLEVKPGDRILISTTTLAEPLLRAVYQAALEAGAALVECDLAFAERERILLQYGSEQALTSESPFTRYAMEQFDCYLAIRAPFNLRDLQNTDKDRRSLRQQANAQINKIYFERTADRRLRRNLCQYPTQAAAQEAGMSLSEYERFVFGACRLYEDDPAAAWRQVRADQQRIVDRLSQATRIRYRNAQHGTDIAFSTLGRTWINSDGKTNMPSGEVYTSPVEDSVEGVVHFTYPCIWQGQEVEGVTLHVRQGYVERWEAIKGKEVLDQVFELPGTRRFGEAAIGTNYHIQQITKNILFDEKIGGAIHLAIGQSYLQAGGKNESPVHWDMITDMRNGGEIFADDQLVYLDGHFL